jgi:hypothetical protein
MRALVTTLLLTGAAANAQQTEFFEAKIRPILVSHCYACHSADTKPASGLRVDDYAGILRGGQSGPAVVPGDPEKSLLMQRVRHENPKRRMPKEGDPLTAAEIADLSAWIKSGAWSIESVDFKAASYMASYERIRARRCAFRPVNDPKPPAAVKSAWPIDDVDRFILAKIEPTRLSPVADASRLTLIRRLTYDLTGLPPALAEIEAFLTDRSSAAYTRLVDRLLASLVSANAGGGIGSMSHAGESSGPSRNIPYPHAWRYRDYVIRRRQRDVPYDRFLQEQIAGDLLPAANAAAARSPPDCHQILGARSKDVNQRFEERYVMDNACGADRYADAIDPCPYGGLRPLPRPQIRSDPHRRLLRAGWNLHQYRRCRRRPQQDGRRRTRLLRTDNAGAACVVRTPRTQRRNPETRRRDRRGKEGMGGHPRQSRRLGSGTGRQAPAAGLSRQMAVAPGEAAGPHRPRRARLRRPWLARIPAHRRHRHSRSR